VLQIKKTPNADRGTEYIKLRWSRKGGEAADNSVIGLLVWLRNSDLCCVLWLTQVHKESEKRHDTIMTPP